MEVQEADIQSLVCPDNVKPALSGYASCLADVLGENIVAAYVCGSIVRGCYQPITSDVDVVVVVKDDPPESLPASMLLVQRYSRLPVDAVVLTESQLHADVFPTPLQFLMKPGLGEVILPTPGGSRDLLLMRQDAYEAGVALVGPPAQGVISAVPWPLLTESLDFLFPNIVLHFKNPVLTLCRVAYNWTNHQLCSKEQAGDWACEALGAQWFSMIRTALTEYACGNGVSTTPRDFVRSFEAYCANYIDSLR